MKSVISWIAEAIDDINYDDFSDTGDGKEFYADDTPVRITPARRRPASVVSGRYDGEAYIEIALLDDRGNYSRDGDLYDLTNDRELPGSLDFLRPGLEYSTDYYGELIIRFTAEMYHEEGERDEFGRLITPPAEGDDRSVTGAVLKVGGHLDGPELEIDANYLNEIELVFESDIKDAFVNTERDDYDE